MQSAPLGSLHLFETQVSLPPQSAFLRHWTHWRYVESPGVLSQTLPTLLLEQSALCVHWTHF
jgi:hypothetical protein